MSRLGFPLAFGETQALLRLVGHAVAAELLLEGRVLSGAEAAARGLVTRVTTPDELDAHVAQAVANLCASGCWASRSHKRQLRRLMRDARPVTRAERDEVYAFAETSEYREGPRKFLKRAR